LLIVAIENKPDKNGEYSISIDRLLAHGTKTEQLDRILKSLTRFLIEWSSSFPVNIEGQSHLLKDATVLRNEVKFSFHKQLLAPVREDPHFFALLEVSLNKVAA